MWVGIITLFPEMFAALNVGITGRAQKDQILKISTWNPRNFAKDKHKSVDDHPYGGGAGMVMMAEPLKLALDAAKEAAPEPPLVIYLSPQGKRFDQEAAERFAGQKPNPHPDMKPLILLAGRYEGIDERIIQQEVHEEWSIGDYVLTGGELAALVMIDAITRLLPGTVGDQDSVATDTLTSGLLKYPQYTRPEHFLGLSVPKVLLSGNHQEIRRWRLKISLGKTWLRRPDLLAKKHLNQEENELLNEFIDEFYKNTEKN